MPAYNFKSEFVPAIIAGIKVSTIRKPRKRPTKVRDTLYLYEGLRTKKAHLIASKPCFAVISINILEGHKIALGSTVIDDDLMNRLVQEDGFKSPDDFFDFFDRQYGIPTLGMELIKWL
jgi:hypothetical protein